MSKFDHVWKHYFPNRRSPEAFVEHHLLQLEKLDNEKSKIWRDIQYYFAAERSSVSEQIVDSLLAAKTVGPKFSAYRIVNATYGADPLCTYGSLIDGGRFNISTDLNFTAFDCLYVGDAPQTCYQEKFHELESELVEGLSGADRAIIPSHNTVLLKLDLGSTLDLRDKDSLAHFLKVVSRIKIPANLIHLWEKAHRKRKTKAPKISSLRTLDALIVSIFDPQFKQYNAFLDIPSNSQWLGYWVREAGIESITYPSVRLPDRFNVAVFPAALAGTDSAISIEDPAPYIDKQRAEMTGENCQFFKYKESELRAFELTHRN